MGAPDCGAVVSKAMIARAFTPLSSAVGRASVSWVVRHPFLDVDGPIALAHRGGAGSYPENTLRAFCHAVSLGFTHIETDVHATADGVAVAFHDDALERVTNGRGAVGELSWQQIRQYKVNGTDPIVRLDELLEALPDTRINLDPKSDAAVEPLVDTVRRLDAVERVCVCSFSDQRTRRVKALLGPSLCVGAGPRGVLRLMTAAAQLRVSRHLRASRAFDFQVAQVPLRARGIKVVNRSLIEAAHRHGVDVHVWTIDDPTEMHALLDLGVDGIMTDQPEQLRRVMIKRGHWSA